MISKNFLGGGGSDLSTKSVNEKVKIPNSVQSHKYYKEY